MVPLGWELLPHAANSPDMAPSDYHLFQSLQHHLADTHFVTLAKIRKCIDDFIASRNLLERWQKVMQTENISLINIFLFYS